MFEFESKGGMEQIKEIRRRTFSFALDLESQQKLFMMKSADNMAVLKS
jgi:hypothetical protein